MSLVRSLFIAMLLWAGLPAVPVHAQDASGSDAYPTLVAERAAIAERLYSIPLDPYEATAARQSGDRAMVRHYWTEAASEYERAIAIDGGDARTWLRLAEARRRAGLTPEALNAATAARALAITPVDRAAAWALVARALDRLGERETAAQAYETSLAEIADPNVERAYRALERRMRFAMTGRELITDGDDAQLCLQFAAPLRDREALNYRDYVTVRPSIDPVFSIAHDKLCIAGFDYGRDYTLTILAGMPAADGRTLEDDVALDVPVPDREPLIGFRTSAYVLPRIGSTGVPLTTVNVDEAELTLLRINDRNLVQQVRDGYMQRLFTTYDRDWVVSDLGEEVWTGTVAINSVANQRVVTSVPVQEMVPEIEPGVYILMAEGTNRALEYWEERATQWLIVSDIGLTTYRGDDGLTVVARSLHDAKPLPGVTVTLYARNNEPLGELVTSSEGLARFAPGLMRGEQGMTPILLMATHRSGDFSYLDLSAPAFDLSDRGVGGRYVDGPYDAFLYTDRGVYRPGETAQLVALLRDDRGNALTGLPLFIDLIRPDGTIARTVQAEETGMGGYHVPLEFSTASQTGRWDAYAYVDPEGAAVGSIGFLVEDVVPARIETTLATADNVIGTDRTLEATVAAAYLYGAPAAELAVQGELVIDRDPDPFPEYPGFHFGLADETVEPTRISVEGAKTDSEGISHLSLSMLEWTDTANPLRATLYVDVLEPGGRAVSETLNLPIVDKPAAIGIRPDFDGDVAPQSSSAEFDILLLDTSTREPLPVDGLRYQLVREDWNYRWYYRYGVWDYDVSITDVPLGSGSVEAKGTAGTVDVSLDWGYYRIEVFDPETGVAASYRFSAGWYGRPGDGDTPDQMQVELDGDSFQPGQTVRALITAPFEGPVQLVLASDTIHRIWSVDADSDGVVVDIEADGEWGAGAYLMATAFRPATNDDQHGPGRAVGVAWIALDRSLRTLDVSIDAPDQVEPRQRIEVPVTVAGLEPNGSAYLTLAAVDEGVLQLTDFEDPDPADHYLGKRHLGIEIRDLYGKLLDGNAGARGEIRSGGDGGAGRRGAPPQIELVALFSGIVELDERGQTTIVLDLPDYNGRLRLMAVAWDDERIGSASEPLVVRDPVATVISTPRFLAPGDRSEITVTVQNLDGPAGEYILTVTGDESVAVTDPTSLTLTLDVGAAETHAIGIDGVAVGSGDVTVALTGPDDWSVQRAVSLGVRPAQLPTLDRVAYRLDPGESLTVGGDIAARFVPGSGEALLSFGGRPELDVAGLLRSLDRYPYGCLEQTTSRAMPLLYVAEVARLWGQAEDEAELRGRIEGAITRILDMQRWDGSFGMWSGYSYTDSWLSAYAMDFLTRARAFGYDVPEFSYRSGIDWLTSHATYYDAREPYDLASRSYAAYVLASAGYGDAAPLRYMFDTLARDSNGMPLVVSPLTMAHLGAGLALFGEIDRAQTAFQDAVALDRGRTSRYFDYGSQVRDLALTIALAAETGVASFDTVAAAERLIELYTRDAYLSTQEEGALLLAAARIGGSADYSLAIGDAEPVRMNEPLRIYRAGDALAEEITYRNAGEQPVWANVTLIGTPVEILPREDSGISIERTYFDLDGNEIDPTTMQQGQIALVLLDVDVVEQTPGDVLVVDLLPAGLEAENPQLADARNAEAFGWLPDLAIVDHAEYRDDRFMAAVWWEQGPFSVAYLVRAVTPGEFAHPAPVAEAMYQPSIRGRGEAGRMTVTAAP